MEKIPADKIHFSKINKIMEKKHVKLKLVLFPFFICNKLKKWEKIPLSI